MAGSGVTVNSVRPASTRSEGATAVLQEKVDAGQPLGQAGIDLVKAHRPTGRAPPRLRWASGRRCRYCTVRMDGDQLVDK